jgi:hypothetical protein
MWAFLAFSSEAAYQRLLAVDEACFRRSLSDHTYLGPGLHCVPTLLLLFLYSLAYGPGGLIALFLGAAWPTQPNLLTSSYGEVSPGVARLLSATVFACIGLVASGVRPRSARLATLLLLALLAIALHAACLMLFAAAM